jgi:hypothetical protein
MERRMFDEALSQKRICSEELAFTSADNRPEKDQINPLQQKGGQAGSSVGIQKVRSAAISLKLKNVTFP